MFYEYQGEGFSVEESLSLSETVFGQGIFSQSDYGNSGKSFEGPSGGKERSNGRAVDSGSGEDVKYHLSTDTPTQDRISEIANKEVVFHEELIELARQNKEEFVKHVKSEESLQKRLKNAERQMILSKTAVVDRRAVTRITKEAIESVKGTVNVKDIFSDVASVYDDYRTAVSKSGRIEGKLQDARDNLVRRFTDIAADIVDSARVPSKRTFFATVYDIDINNNSALTKNNLNAFALRLS